MTTGVGSVAPGAQARLSTAPGAVERALSSLWPVARARLLEPRNLFTYLGLSWRFDLRTVRPSQVKVLAPRGVLPDCDACVELCCTGPNAQVTLRLLDIARLVDAGLDGSIVPRPDSTTKAEGHTQSPAARRLDASVFARMFPVLDRDATGTCRLLTHDRRCGAWPRWPLSCQRYPYAFDAEHRVVFLAEGCRSHRFHTVEDPPDAVRALVAASLQAYNERVRDIVLLHLALSEVHELGLLRFLSLEGRLSEQAEALGPHPSPPRDAPPPVVVDPTAPRRLKVV